MNTAILDTLEKLAKRVASGQITEDAAGAFMRRLINSPAVALLVRLTPNPVDDLALELLKSLFPAA